MITRSFQACYDSVTHRRVSPGVWENLVAILGDTPPFFHEDPYERFGYKILIK